MRILTRPYKITQTHTNAHSHNGTHTHKRINTHKHSHCQSHKHTHIHTYTQNHIDTYKPKGNIYAYILHVHINPYTKKQTEPCTFIYIHKCTNTYLNTHTQYNLCTLTHTHTQRHIDIQAQLNKYT